MPLVYTKIYFKFLNNLDGKFLYIINMEFQRYSVSETNETTEKFLSMFYYLKVTDLINPIMGKKRVQEQ